MTTVRQFAAAAAAYFELAVRSAYGGEHYARTRADAPDWVRDLVREAHDGMIPDDWRYACIWAALDCIAAADDSEDARHEWADAYVSTYTDELLAWLGSHPYRVSYVDDAVAELGHSDSGIGDIALGQYAEAREVYGCVLTGMQCVKRA